MLIACVVFAEHYERIGICIPLFGVSGTVEDVTYTVETDYVYHPGPYYYAPPPPPPRHHIFHHHHHHTPPPPHHFHRPPPPRHGPPHRYPHYR